jgi:WD40 repeat protein
VVSASFDQTLRVWDVESGETIRTLEGHTNEVYAVAVLDEKRVVSASFDQTLRVWDVESCETVAVFALDGPVYSVAVTADGRRVVAGDRLGGVHFLDLVLP